MYYSKEIYLILYILLHTCIYICTMSVEFLHFLRAFGESTHENQMSNNDFLFYFIVIFFFFFFGSKFTAYHYDLSFCKFYIIVTVQYNPVNYFTIDFIEQFDYYFMSKSIQAIFSLKYTLCFLNLFKLST